MMGERAYRATVAGVEVSTAHWIDGKRIASGRTFPVFSPIDGSHLANVCAGSAEEIDAAVRAARRAFPAWAALGAEGRQNILRRFADALVEHSKQLAAVETEDNGSLLTRNEHTVDRSALNISYFADWALKMNRECISSPNTDNYVRHDPAGVAAIITPWNGPMMLTTWKMGPALSAGNTVVVKPPEWAPLTCAMMAEIADKAGVPKGVINMVHGIGEEAGAALAAHPDIDRLSFTGSVDTARIIGQSTARTITPVSFELGGKSAFIVLPDADLDLAAGIAAGGYVNAGQGCTRGTRLLVDESIADVFQTKLREATAKLVVGDPRKPTTHVGPLITPEHFARVLGFVERSYADGAEAVWGGHKHDFGDLYFQPTLLGNVRQDMEVVQREVFGPVLCWQTFKNEEQLIELANGTRYGLAAMLFTTSEKNAFRIGSQLVAGSVWVNCYHLRDPLAVPFGGSRNSGIGREGGNWSFDFFCDVKNICIPKGTVK